MKQLVATFALFSVTLFSVYQPSLAFTDRASLELGLPTRSDIRAAVRASVPVPVLTPEPTPVPEPEPDPTLAPTPDPTPVPDPESVTHELL